MKIVLIMVSLLPATVRRLPPRRRAGTEKRLEIAGFMSYGAGGFMKLGLKIACVWAKKLGGVFYDAGGSRWGWFHSSVCM